MQKKYLDYAGLQAIFDKLFAREFKGMGLSHEDFTAELKAKYDALAAGSATAADLQALTSRVADLEILIDSNSDGAINKFNEIVAFLDGIEDTNTLDGIVSGISTQIAGKVDKEEGKGLSSNDYTKAEKDAVATIGNKVDKVAGKGLSTKDYTAADQAAVATIGNKVDKVEGKGLSTKDYTAADQAAVQTIGNKVNEADLVAITPTEITQMLTA